MLLALYEVKTLGSFVCVCHILVRIPHLNVIHHLYTHSCPVGMALICIYTWPHWLLDYIELLDIYIIYSIMDIIMHPYMLNSPSDNKQQMCLVYQWYTSGVFLKHFLQMQYAVSEYMECIIGGNFTLHTNDNLLLYYHIDAYKSLMLGQRYFKSSNNLVVQEWIRVRATLLYPVSIEWARPNALYHFKFIPDMQGWIMTFWGP